jgi:uncharacterized protein (DUF58 family)
VLLDTRLVAHRGDGPTSSLEWAISAAASISVHLARSGFELRLITDTGNEVSSAGLAGASFDANVLDVLAVVAGSTSHTLQAGMTTVRRQGTEGLLVAVVGSLSPDDAESLARMRSGAASVGIALVMDTDSWITQSPEAAQASAAAHQQTCQLLALSGWRAIEVHRGDSIAALWSQAGRAKITATPDLVSATAVAAATTEPPDAA